MEDEDVELEELELEQILAADEVDAPMGAMWFDEACRRMQLLEDAYTRREKRRDALVARATAPVLGWFAREATPLLEKAERIKAAVTERMLDYREATGRKSYTGPVARVSSRIVPEYLAFPKDDTSLLCVLAAIDRSTFVRDKTVSTIDKDNVRSAAEVKDVRVFIDGVELPGVTVVAEQVNVAVSPLPAKGGF